MPLEDFFPETETVQFRGGSFEVRAISLPDVAMLIDVHEHTIMSMASKIYNRRELLSKYNDNPDAVQEIVMDLAGELIRESPILVANLIAICADAPMMMGKAEKLPITVQMDALTKIAKLTFTDLASLKKLYADVVQMVVGILPPEMLPVGEQRKIN